MLPITFRTLLLFLNVRHNIVSFAGCGRVLTELFGNLQVRSSSYYSSITLRCNWEIQNAGISQAVALVSLPELYLSYYRLVCYVYGYLKGHSQLKHLRITCYFLADLPVTRHSRQTESEKRIRNTQNKPCRVELVTNRNRNYRP